MGIKWRRKISSRLIAFWQAPLVCQVWTSQYHVPSEFSAEPTLILGRARNFVPRTCLRDENGDEQSPSYYVPHVLREPFCNGPQRVGMRKISTKERESGTVAWRGSRHFLLLVSRRFSISSSATINTKNLVAFVAVRWNRWYMHTVIARFVYKLFVFFNDTWNKICRNDPCSVFRLNWFISIPNLKKILILFVYL